MYLYSHMQMLVYQVQLSKRVCVVLICYSIVLLKYDAMLICIHNVFADQMYGRFIC